MPPRHASVELRPPEEITAAAKQHASKATELVPGRDGVPRSTRTTMIAVGIGVAIGIALGVVLAVMSL